MRANNGPREAVAQLAIGLVPSVLLVQICILPTTAKMGTTAKIPDVGIYQCGKTHVR
jgi:hypothetical protein